ncbi:MAG: AbrB/MazE/SpoVT family DNA-binding domain-containing protein [Candidatus Omnitrophota bacterium]
MARQFSFQFYATVSSRGQIFIPKPLQDYFGIQNRDKVAFIVQDDGSVVFKKKRTENKAVS